MIPTGWLHIVIGVILLFHKRLGLENKRLAFVMFVAGLLFYPLLLRQNVDYWLGLWRGTTGDYDVESFGVLKLMLYFPFCVALTSILASLLVMINERTNIWFTMNLKKILLVVIITLLMACNLFVFAEAPEELWEKTIGDDGIDIAFSVVESSDGGLALAGFKKTRGANRGDLYLVLTDINGEVMQESLLVEKCTGASIQRTPDGGYIICGTKSQPLVIESMILVKTDENGNVVWNQTYYDTGGYQARSVATVSDGGYIVTGIRWKGMFEIMQDPEHQEPDAFLIRVDEQGDVLWNRTYGSLYDDRGFSVIETDDGGFLLAGSSRPDESSLDMGFLVKTDSDGSEEWSQMYGGEDGQQFQSVCTTSDGGYAAAGFTLSFDAQGTDYYLVKVDERGELAWSNHYGGSGDDEAFDVISGNDGGFVLVGASSVAMDSDRDIGVMRVDSTSELLWEGIYGGGDHDIGYSIISTQNGGYIIAGETSSFGLSTQMYLLKLEADISPEPQGIAGFSIVSILFGVIYYMIDLHRNTS